MAGGQSGGGGGNDEEEDDGRDDYGTTTVLADGSAGGFAEDDAEKRKLAYGTPHPIECERELIPPVQDPSRLLRRRPKPSV